MKRVRTPYGTRCQDANGKFVACRTKSKKRKKGTSGYGQLCRKKNGQFAKCRAGMKRA